MALGAGTPAVYGIRAGLLSPFFAGVLAESADALDQSTRPSLPSLYSRRRRSPCHTPAFCQSLRRLPQVTPLHPSSFGSMLQGMPLLSTYTMPSSTDLAGTLGRPPFGLSDSGGSSGSTSSHSSSLIGGASSFGEPQHNHAAEDDTIPASRSRFAGSPSKKIPRSTAPAGPDRRPDRVSRADGDVLHRRREQVEAYPP